MKLELVLTRWEDGLFKSRDRIESDTIEKLEQQFEVTIDWLKKKIADENNRRYTIAEDDDIPF